ncbi:MAG: biotin transporter BioY [Spirochaetaceae bacterium]|jgi:biotin transport system substrate-specific component|nr:biotin transporter BioY [Spirochaetaceae bacterium]
METVTISRKRKKITGTVMTALFAALTAAGAFIAVPLPFSPVPLVLQNLFALLSGLILGPLLGGAAVGLYLVAGALGAPVFAGASGGFAHFLGPTGGFLAGYLLAAITAGLIAGRAGSPRWRIIPAVLAGFLVVYVPGVIWLKLVIDKPWPAALAAGFFPFLAGDLVKGAAAVIIAPRLRRAAADHLDG